MLSYLQKLVVWYLDLPGGELSELHSLKLRFHAPWPASSWTLSVLASIGLTIVLVALLYWAAAARLRLRRRAVLLGLRLALLVLVIALLCRPSLVLTQADRPYALVLVDRSASMSLVDNYRQAELAAASKRYAASRSGRTPTRWQIALSVLLQDDARLLRRLAENYRVRVYAFDGQSARVGELSGAAPDALERLRESLNSLSPTGRLTRLGPSLQQALEDFRGGSVGAVVLLSDGATTTGSADELTAAITPGQTPPLFTIAVGSPVPPPDIELHHPQAPAVAFVGDVVPVSVRLTAVGLSRSAVEVELVEGNTGRVLSTRTVSLTSDPKAGSSRRGGTADRAPRLNGVGEDGTFVKTSAAEGLRARRPVGRSIESSRTSSDTYQSRPVTREVTLVFRPKQPGEAVLLVRVVPLPEESQRANNQVSLRINVRKDRLKVLLADGAPRWEFRQVKALLEREPTIELHTWLQQGDLEYAQSDATAKPLAGRFPSSIDRLSDYDVIVLGDVDLGGLGRQAVWNLRRFVQHRGGGLLLVAGWSNNPWRYVGTELESVLPVVPAKPTRRTAAQWRHPLRVEFTPAVARAFPTLSLASLLTSHGQAEDRLAGGPASLAQDVGGTRAEESAVPGSASGEPGDWRVLSRMATQLPPLFWVAQVDRIKPGAVVLASVRAEGQGPGDWSPLFVLQRYGSGKVLWHGTDELWRWKRGPSERFWAQYWLQALRALSLTRLVGQTRRAELLADRQLYRAGEPVRLRLHFFDTGAIPEGEDAVRITLLRAGQPFRELTLHQAANSPDEFEISVADLPEGEYRAVVSRPVFAEGAPSTSFGVIARPRELDRRTADYGQLRRAAELTGGRFYTLADVARLPQDLPPGSPVWVDASEPIQLWNRWEPLALFVLLICTEWLLRRRWRLV